MYQKEHAEKLFVIRNIAKENALKRSNKMVDTANSNTKDVLLKKGDNRGYWRRTEISKPL